MNFNTGGHDVSSNQVNEYKSIQNMYQYIEDTNMDQSKDKMSPSSSFQQNIIHLEKELFNHFEQENQNN